MGTESNPPPTLLRAKRLTTSPIYHRKDATLNMDPNVNPHLSDDKDNTRMITNNNHDDNDSIMFNIDDDSIIDQSVPNLNNNE